MFQRYAVVRTGLMSLPLMFGACSVTPYHPTQPIERTVPAPAVEVAPDLIRQQAVIELCPIPLGEYLFEHDVQIRAMEKVIKGGMNDHKWSVMHPLDGNCGD